MMKKSFFLTIILITGGFLLASAQEENFPVTEEETEARVEESNPRESGMQMWELERVQREVGSQNSENQSKTSTQERTTSTSNEKVLKEKNKDPQESVLSFNFLSYLIQRFKLSESGE